MAQRTKANFKSTKNTRFADNATGDISEGDSRDMFEDVADSFLSIDDNFIDEDSFASDSASKAPSQQSVKAYVEAQSGASISSSSWKDPCAVATTANITLSGEQTIDGVLTSASRVLVKNQTDASENGIYVSAAGAWARSTDADEAAELEGAAVSVGQGTVGANLIYIQTSDSIVLETTDIVWEESNSIPDASATIRGLVSTTTQTFGGVKTFSSTGISGFQRTTASLTGDLFVAFFKALSSGNMTDGLAALAAFYIQDDAGVSNNIGAIGATRAGADNTGDLIFQTVAAGTRSTKMRLTSAGVLNLTTTPTVANTNTNLLTIDGSGNVEVRTASTLMLSDGDKGDITVSSSGAAWAIDSNVLSSGTYTPTLTNSVNISSSDAFTTFYTRIKNTIHVTGIVSITPTAGSANTMLGISLPVASDLSSPRNCLGVANEDSFLLGTVALAGFIFGDDTSNIALLRFQNNAGTTQKTFNFHFTYIIE